MPVQMASLFAAIGCDLSGLNRGLEDAQSRLKNAGAKIQGIGVKMTAGITLPLIGIGVAAVKMGADFEQQMGLLGIALRGAGADMDSVREYALQMGADTVFNAREMTDAMIGLAKSGQSWEQIAGDMSGATGTLAAVTNLAAASDLELSSAADAVAVAMATFNRPASDAVAIVDNFVQAADASVAEVGGLVDALRNVGPTAAAFGWSLEDVNTALAVLSERGIQGGEAGTALKSMMTNMMRPTDKVTDALEDLNVKLYDSNGAMRSLPEIMGSLEKGLAGMTQEQRNQYIQTLAGTYGMKAMQTLLTEGVTGWEGMEGAIAGAATAQDVADVKMGGLKGTLEELSGSMETVGIKIGGVIIPVIKDLIDNYVLPFIDSLIELNPGIVKWGLVLAGVAAAAGPLLGILGTLITVVGAIGAPVLLVVAAVGALGVAFATNFMGIRDVVMSAWEKIRPVVQQLAAWFQEQLPKAMEAFQEVANAVLAEVVPFIIDLFGQVVTWFEENWPLIQETFETVVQAIQDFWAIHGADIMEAVQFVWESIETIISTALDVILSTITLIMQMITGDWEGAWQTVQEIAETIWDAIKSIFGSWFQAILALLGSSLAEFVAMWSTNFEMAKTIVTTILNNIKEIIGKFSLRTVGENLIESLKSGIKAKARSIADAAAKIVRDAIAAAKAAVGIHSPSKVFMAIGNDISRGLALGISRMAGAPMRAIESMAGSLQDAMPGASDLGIVGPGGTKPGAGTAMTPDTGLGEGFRQMWLSWQKIKAGLADAASGAGAIVGPGGTMPGMGMTPIGAGSGCIINVNFYHPVYIRRDGDIDDLADRIARRTQLRGGFRTMHQLGTG